MAPKVSPFVFVLVITFAISNANILPNSFAVQAKISEVQSRNPRLTAIGTFNKKVYFTIPGLKLYAEDAHKACRDNFLHPVKFESTPELTYVMGLLSKESPTISYWTGAVDKRQFSWGDGTAIALPWHITRTYFDNGISIQWNGLHRMHGKYPNVETMCEAYV